MTKNPSTSSSQEVQDLLGDGLARRWWQSPTFWIGTAAVVVAAGGFVWWQAEQKAKAKPVYVTDALKRGNLSLNVSANGTLQPTRTVSVGSELSGTVRQVSVDVNDTVRKGQVLVELDTDKLAAQVGRSRATLASAQAKQSQTEATLKEARANMARLDEVHRLSGGQVPSATELDSGRAALARAQADVAAAKASVDDARNALSTDETNLSKASVKASIDGVVLTRSVEPGQAVAASLQAVTLFTVAEDLKKLRLEVAVDEADVGTVQEGQQASFTVSAYPARRYPATVTRVDYGSTKTDNVVTYVARLAVDNEDLSLRPGMTASASIRSTERHNVLLVPNAALRFTPTGMQNPGQAAAGSGGREGGPREGGAKPQGAGNGGGGIVGQLMPRPPRQGGGNRGEQAQAPGQTRYVWVLQAGQPEAVQVKTGLSDGRMTEVDSEQLKEGDLLITDQRSGAGR